MKASSGSPEKPTYRTVPSFLSLASAGRVSLIICSRPHRRSEAVNASGHGREGVRLIAAQATTILIQGNKGGGT